MQTAVNKKLLTTLPAKNSWYHFIISFQSFSEYLKKTTVFNLKLQHVDILIIKNSIAVIKHSFSFWNDTSFQVMQGNTSGPWCTSVRWGRLVKSNSTTDHIRVLRVRKCNFQKQESSNPHNFWVFKWYISNWSLFYHTI